VLWPELIHAMMECLSCQTPSLKEAAFTILGAEPTLLLYPNPALGPIPPFDALFLGGLQDPDADVSLAALKACVYFLLESDDQTRPTLASRWISDMVRVCL
jgi:hypothetical protein